MASDMDKLRTLLTRRTADMKDILEDPDFGDMTRSMRMLETSNDLVDDLMLLIGDMMERRDDDFERSYDRYRNQRDDDRDRDRDRDSRRGDSRDRGRGGRRSFGHR